MAWCCTLVERQGVIEIQREAETEQSNCLLISATMKFLTGPRIPPPPFFFKFPSVLQESFVSSAQVEHRQ